MAAQACPTISAQVQYGEKKNQEESLELEVENLYGEWDFQKRAYQLRGLIGGLSEASSWFFRVGWTGRHPITTTAKPPSFLKRGSSSLATLALAPPPTCSQSPLFTPSRQGGNHVEVDVGPFGLADWPTGRRGHALLFGHSSTPCRGRAHNRCAPRCCHWRTASC